MNIGSVVIHPPTVLAPLAGITHLPFRLMVKRAGCGLVCSEMVSAKGLMHRSRKTRQLLDSHPEEHPLSIQIFGAEPDTMAAAAETAAAAGAAVVDINMGCAVRKILKSNSGVALMREPETVKKLLTAVRRAVSVPLTIKIRSGWDPSGNQALEISRIAVDAGVDAIAVHPRTATQGFGGTADWRLIARIKAAIPLPIIGNGDIITAADALRMIRQTGCDAVMIGRTALANPWIFSQTASLLAGDAPGAVSHRMRMDAVTHYLTAAVDYFGEAHACRMMRSRLGWLTKGLPHSSRFRETISRITSAAEALNAIATFRNDLTIADTHNNPAQDH